MHGTMQKFRVEADRCIVQLQHAEAVTVLHGACGCVHVMCKQSCIQQLA